MARCELHISQNEQGEFVAQLRAEGGPLVEPHAVDLEPSNVTQAILRQLRLSPDKRALLPPAQVRGTGERLWQGLGASAEKLSELLRQGRVDLVIVSEHAQALDTPWEALREPEMASPVREGLLEVVRADASPGTGGQAQGPLLLSLPKDVEAPDAWQLAWLQAAEPLARSGELVVGYGEDSTGLRACDSETITQADCLMLRDPMAPSKVLELTEGARCLCLHAPLDAANEGLWIASVLQALTQGADIFAALRAARSSLSEAGAYSWMQPAAVLRTHTGPLRSEGQWRPAEIRQEQLKQMRVALVLSQHVLVQGAPPLAESLLTQALHGMPHHVLPAHHQAMVDELAMALKVRRVPGPGASAAFEADLRAALSLGPIIAVADTPGELVPELGAIAALGGTLAMSSPLPVDTVDCKQWVLGPLNPSELLRLKLSEPAFRVMTPELWQGVVQTLDADQSSLRLLPAWLKDAPERVSELQEGVSLMELVLQDLPQPTSIALHSASGLDLDADTWRSSPLPFEELLERGLLCPSLRGWRTLPELPATRTFLGLERPEVRALALAKLGDAVQALEQGAIAVHARVQATAAQAAIALAQELLRLVSPEGEQQESAAVPLLSDLARAHDLLGEGLLALAALENAFAWAPRDADLQRRLGAALVRNGQIERAQSLLEPLDSDPEALLELALSQEDPERSLATLERAQALAQGPLAAELMGHRMRRTQAPSAQLALAQARVELDPSPQALADLATLSPPEKAMALHTRRLESQDPVERSGAHLDLARLLMDMDRPSQALEELELAWELALARHRPDAIAGVGSMLGQLLAGVDKERALKVLEQAQSAYERLSQSEQALKLAAMIVDIQGGAVADSPERSLQAARATGDLMRVSTLQFKLAQQDLREGELDEARERLEEAWGIVHRGDRDDGRSAIGLLYAQLLSRAGRQSVALAVAQAALAASERLDHPQQVERLKELMQRLRQDPEQVLQDAREAGHRDKVAALQFQLGSHQLREGQHAEASIRIAESWRLNLELEDPRGIGVVGAVHGQLLAMQGQQSKARQVYQRALQAARQLQEPGLVSHLEQLIKGL